MFTGFCVYLWMKRNGKEFEDLRGQFEKDLHSMPVYVGRNLEREDRDSTVQVYYQNGEVNRLFIAYMHGYQHAKCLARVDALELSD